MVEDVATNEPTEECLYVQAGKGIQDSGCTAPVMGERTWDQWLHLLCIKGLNDRVEEAKSDKTFKFGNGATLSALKMVRFPIKMYGQETELEVHIIPGETPLLLSRDTLARWGVIQDFRNAKVTFVDSNSSHWYDVERSAKGHFVFDLLGQFEDRIEDAIYLETVYEEDPEVTVVAEHPWTPRKVNALITKLAVCTHEPPRISG